MAHSIPKPTEVELQILKVLWDIGTATVRQVHEQLTVLKETDYATTVKMLRIMLEKKLVSRNDKVRPLVYRAAVTQERTQRSMLGDLVDRLYDGASGTLVMHALSGRKASASDIAEIRRMLDELEGNET